MRKSFIKIPNDKALKAMLAIMAVLLITYLFIIVKFFSGFKYERDTYKYIYTFRRPTHQ